MKNVKLYLFERLNYIFPLQIRLFCPEHDFHRLSRKLLSFFLFHSNLKVKILNINNLKIFDYDRLEQLNTYNTLQYNIYF